MMDRGIRKGEGGVCPLVASHRVALRYIALRTSDGFVLNSIVSKKTKKNNKGSDIEEMRNIRNRVILQDCDERISDTRFVNRFEIALRSDRTTESISIYMDERKL